MLIVINISEDLYVGIERRDAALETEYVCYELINAVDNGTPLESILCNSPYTEVLNMIKDKYRKEDAHDH